MNRSSTGKPPCIFPTFRYRDGSAMVKWLEKALNFEIQEHHEADGRLIHAELALGNSMIMVGQTADDLFGDMVGGPGEQGGKATYIAVSDPDALFEKAQSAGATILQELTERDYGSRDFICADPEGNVWCIGTYWPKVKA